MGTFCLVVTMLFFKLQEKPPKSDNQAPTEYEVCVDNRYTFKLMMIQGNAAFL